MTGELRMANFDRDELALWIFEGANGCEAPAKNTVAQSIAEIEALGQDFEDFRNAADHVLSRLLERFAMSKQ